MARGVGFLVLEVVFVNDSESLRSEDKHEDDEMALPERVNHRAGMAMRYGRKKAQKEQIRRGFEYLRLCVPCALWWLKCLFPLASGGDFSTDQE
jgi:hypothetical protein